MAQESLRFRVRRQKPDRRQKDKGCQSLPAGYWSRLRPPGRQFMVPRNEGKFHGLDVTNRARSDSVSGARSRREATRRPPTAVRVLGGQVSGGQAGAKAVSTDHKKPRG